MPDGVPPEITILLNHMAHGDAAATQTLLNWLYGELRGLARRQVAGQVPHPTLQATVVVHEAYLRLFGRAKNVEWANRRHFFAAATQVMRQIRIDDARRRKRLKRGGGRRAEPLDNEPGVFDKDPNDVLAVHEALEGLEAADPRKAELVRLRYFAGLTEQETADVMELSRRTVQMEWRIARAWLHRALSKGDTETPLSL
jgi:RNA polymerase sigma factor (TIGR02999 family)